MRKSARLSCSLMLGILLMACNSPPKPQEFKSEAGGFAVTAPVALTERIQAVETQVGKIDYHMFLGEQNNAAYSVGYADFPPALIQKSDPEKLLDGSRNGTVSRVNGELVTETRIALKGNPGRELVIDAMAKSEADMTIMAHLFLVGNRLYMVMVAAKKGRLSGSAMDDFLRSFQLTGK
jgi:hypothetical protein